MTDTVDVTPPGGVIDVPLYTFVGGEPNRIGSLKVSVTGEGRRAAQDVYDAYASLVTRANATPRDTAAPAPVTAIDCAEAAAAALRQASEAVTPEMAHALLGVADIWRMLAETITSHRLMRVKPGEGE